MLAFALGAAAALVLAGIAILVVAARSRARHLADDVRVYVEPYLRRKAAEAGLAADAPTWTRRARPEEIVGYSARLGARLLERERAGVAAVAPGKSGEDVAFENTQPVDLVDPAILSK